MRITRNQLQRWGHLFHTLLAQLWNHRLKEISGYPNDELLKQLHRSLQLILHYYLEVWDKEFVGNYLIQSQSQGIEKPSLNLGFIPKYT